ncbi:hypothetical protein [Serpentinicella alkaliphila]|uniref:Twitching motility protein PilT n=1 Tax=Serpentinicella alkaliphila TaxID=1734049 RepID=A0A4R2TX61_9FIRM|nr:hypothetical protein [Serpentinicella alkaliphila]QUH25783.1 hypothetical protein HZR23_08560 [Serpentinicella alkaliphila]TCP99782.1 hypothetical protein EDD79_103326 [Serpentinicella alkaliphila]
MIKLIVGREGGGKTKALIELANEALKKTKGNIVFLDYDNNNMYQIDYRIRFMSVTEYKIVDEAGLYGFICGVIASNYDVENIYIDGIYKLTNKDISELKDFIKALTEIEIKYNVNFTITVTGEEKDLPDYLKKYVIQAI